MKKYRFLAETHINSMLLISRRPRPRKLRIREREIPDLNLAITSDGEEQEETVDNSLGLEPQDADYSEVPQLNHEVEVLILARFPRSEYWKLRYLNRQFSLLLKSGELFKVRREIGFSEPSVFMLSISDICWRTFDKEFNSCRKLPTLPSDECFSRGDKESLCAGTHLIVSGREIESIVVWRYELETNKWQKGPSMITPRCLFASATCGTCAFVAGGKRMKKTGDIEVLNTAEKYNAETKTWVPLPVMHKRRNFCSGCYLGNQFYVLGGRNEKGEHLTCGESYNESKNTWELIPDMLKDSTFSTSQSPPLIAVAKNELFSLETTSNELRVYIKSTNTWKTQGFAPVRAQWTSGWGVAFKSLGDQLLVIGASSAPCSGEAMAVYTCSPMSDMDELQWKEVACCCECRLNHFILNCSVMVA